VKPPTGPQTSLMSRRYDLRDSGVTWRLNSSVYPAKVAAWTGHSVEFLLSTLEAEWAALDAEWEA
jgi:hypothetical protein